MTYASFFVLLQKINGGIVMVNFYDCYVIENCAEKSATVQDIVRECQN